MDTNYEHHIYNKEGDLKALKVIDTAKTTGDRWERIDQTIKDYITLHPNEMRMLVMENKAISNSRLNDYASDKSKSIRFGASVPFGLMVLLEQIEPFLFTEKELFYRFIKKYKGFKICKTV